MNYCNHCGTAVQLCVPEGDNRLRHVCVACGRVHYQNPKIVVGCIPEWQQRLLLCQRAIEPGIGLWTLPAGFMERGETLQQGAARETWEEAGAQVTVSDLYAVFNLPRIDHVYLLFRAQLHTAMFAPGTESLDVRLFAVTELPWEQLAFSVIHETLRLYVQDQARGSFPLHTGDIPRRLA